MEHASNAPAFRETGRWRDWRDGETGFCLDSFAALMESESIECLGTTENK